jgi:uncharacterized protein YndB with AHSA1/START domain
MTAKMSAKTSRTEVAEAGRVLTMTRLIQAPREVVWAMWTDPKHLAQWWGPKGFSAPVCELEPRAGGALRIVMRGPDGIHYDNRGVVRVADAPTRLEFAIGLLDADGSKKLENLTVVTLKPKDDGTELTVHVRVLSETHAGRASVEGMNAGWNESLDRLEALTLHA